MWSTETRRFGRWCGCSFTPFVEAYRHIGDVSQQMNSRITMHLFIENYFEDFAYIDIDYLLSVFIAQPICIKMVDLKSTNGFSTVGSILTK